MAFVILFCLGSILILQEDVIQQFSLAKALNLLHFPFVSDADLFLVPFSSLCTKAAALKSHLTSVCFWSVSSCWCSSYQFKYRNEHQTETVLIGVPDKPLSSIDRRFTSVVTFLSLSLSLTRLTTSFCKTKRVKVMGFRAKLFTSVPVIFLNANEPLKLNSSDSSHTITEGSPSWVSLAKCMLVSC